MHLARSPGFLVWVLLALCLAARSAVACGPFFPNYLLDRGDAAVLTVPEARFRDELRRMRLVTSVHRAVGASSQPQQTLAGELADLRAALEQAGVPADQRELICVRHRKERERISLFAPSTDPRAVEAVAGFANEPTHLLRPDPTNAARIPGPVPQIVPGLPGEFADYFRGSIAWHQGDWNGARREWTALLARPAKERRFKSTWAAFMLGKSWEEEDFDRACRCFQSVRQWATNGFADSIGLAASSLGWEARCRLRDRRYAEAIDLYLEQAATGDDTAIISLQWAAEAALVHGRNQHRALAAHPRAQRVITACLISGGHDSCVDVDNPLKEAGIRLLAKTSTLVPALPSPKPAWHRYESTLNLWLQALEDARVTDVASAESIALAAYQAGQWQTTQRWIQRARVSPVTQWLQAKLYLRDGKVDEAAALLARVCREFPAESSGTNLPASARFEDSLYLQAGEFDFVSVAQAVRGELGVFLLARRQYLEALDTLLRSAPAYWMDAAYVAERVLSLDELKAYVDRHWPAPPQAPGTPSPAVEAWGPSEGYARLLPRDYARGENLRYLLARRLARAGRRAEARPYFPAGPQPAFDKLAAALREAESQDQPAPRRAAAFFEAAQITRRSGLELLGTEVEPDFRIHDGNFQDGVTIAARASLQGSNCLAASSEELERAKQHCARPEERWHYRRIAASLAARGAMLMRDAKMPGLPPAERARVLFESAKIAHERGGDWAEVEPSDTNSLAQSHASPSERLLAPYPAAALAWKAAQMMPDNSDATARVLCTGGCWIKSGDPRAADVFYKALVRRCRKTVIGAEADRLRWFPRLDERGELQTNQPPSPAGRATRAQALRPTPSPTNSVDEPDP